jgi:hypothetical protein
MHRSTKVGWMARVALDLDRPANIVTLQHASGGWRPALASPKLASASRAAINFNTRRRSSGADKPSASEGNSCAAQEMKSASFANEAAAETRQR